MLALGVQPDPSGQFVQSLARGLAVIRAFDAEHPHMTLSEIAKRTELTRATVRRFLLTLETLGYVRCDGRIFTLTPRVLELGYSYLASMTLPEIAQPHLEALSRQLDESTSASVLDGDDIVYVARVSARRIMHVGITIGTRFPAYATSMGRVLLAHQPHADVDRYLQNLRATTFTPSTVTGIDELRATLDAVRRQGWAIVDQELEHGLRSIAVPLHRGNTVIAAINVSTTSTSSLEKIRNEYRHALLETAASISADLSHAR